MNTDCHEYAYIDLTYIIYIFFVQVANSLPLDPRLPPPFFIIAKSLYSCPQFQVPSCITVESEVICPVPTLCLSHGKGSHLVFVRTGC